MKWLESPQNGAESFLRQALDEAAFRTGDEIARRRLWTRLSTPLGALRVRPWLMRTAMTTALVAGTAGALLVWPRSVSIEPIPEHRTAPVAKTSPEPREPTALARVPLLDGPKIVRTKARERARLRLWGGTEADLEPNSTLVVDDKHRPAIERGRVSLAVPRQEKGHHFELGAGPYKISVLGTRFHVRVAGDSVGVDVDEGVVEVWHNQRVVRVEAGEAWTSPSTPRHSARKLPPRRVASAAPPPGWSSAPAEYHAYRAALAEGHPQKAVEILESVARGEGPAAENAAYEVGKVLRDNLSRPRQALSAWKRYRARFPRGVLRVEVDLYVLETLGMLDDRAAALGEAQDFLARYPDSERRAEISRLVERLRQETRGSASGRERSGGAGPTAF
jgi:FecR protein